MLFSLARLSFLAELLFSPMGCYKNQKSRSRHRCRSLFLVLGAFGARRIFEFCNTSNARMLFLHVFAAHVLLAFRFFTSSTYWKLLEHALANSRSKPRTILILFARTRFSSAMSLPPKRQQHYFSIREDIARIETSFPRWRCRRTRFSRSRLCCRSHVFVALVLVGVHAFWFLNPSNGILRVLFEMTLSVMSGDLDFRKLQIRRVYFARGVQKMIAYFAIFKST